MPDSTEVVFTDEEFEKFAEAWSEGGTVSQISYESGLSPEHVRAALNDPATQRALAQKKANKMGLFLIGRGMDRLKEIITDGSDSQAISAIKTLTEMMGKVSDHEPEVKQLPAQTLEAQVRELEK
jgi:hypothetical protein